MWARGGEANGRARRGATLKGGQTVAAQLLPTRPATAVLWLLPGPLLVAIHSPATAASSAARTSAPPSCLAVLAPGSRPNSAPHSWSAHMAPVVKHTDTACGGASSGGSSTDACDPKTKAHKKRGAATASDNKLGLRHQWRHNGGWASPARLNALATVLNRLHAAYHHPPHGACPARRRTSMHCSTSATAI
jgi:hypothetical protein